MSHIPVILGLRLALGMMVIILIDAFMALWLQLFERRHPNCIFLPVSLILVIFETFTGLHVLFSLYGLLSRKAGLIRSKGHQLVLKKLRWSEGLEIDGNILNLVILFALPFSVLELGFILLLWIFDLAFILPFLTEILLAYLFKWL
jgi:hypothetical protein